MEGREDPAQPTVSASSIGGDATAAGRDIHITHIYHDDEVSRADSPARASGECPYPGLAPFATEQHRWFYGREKAVTAICKELARRDEQARFPLVVIGASGAGKTSLLAAGVVPAVANGDLPLVAGASTWRQIMFTPTSRPSLSLALAFGLEREMAEAAARTWYASPEQCITDLLMNIATYGDGTTRDCLLVIDQFEELFTLCGTEEERKWYIDILSRLVRPVDGLLVVLGVRADFYAACAEYPQLRHALRVRTILLEPMDTLELKRAIRQPAENVGLTVENGLVDLLLADLGADSGRVRGRGADTSAGRLPLLAYALQATWQARSGHTLTVAGYRRTGGIHGALAEAADRVWHSLSDEGRDLARVVFLRLVVVGGDADDARRHLSRSDLLADLPDRELAGSVVDAFTAARLLTEDQETVTITHEILVREWPLLRDWIDGDRVGNLIRQDLEDATAAWARSGRDASALLRGSRLGAARTWMRSRPADVSAPVRAFVSASTRLERRGRRIRRRLVALVSVLALGASGAALFAFRQEGQALDNLRLAVRSEASAASLELAGSNPSLAAQLALEAYRLHQDPATEAALVNTENTPLASVVRVGADSVTTVLYSPDGHLIAAGSQDGTVRFWAVTASGQLQLLPGRATVPRGWVSALAFSPDGRVLAVSSQYGDVTLWGMTQPDRPREYGRPLAVSPGRPAFSVAFGFGGRLLAVASQDNTVRLWNVTSPARPVPVGRPLVNTTGFILAINFSPVSHVLAVGGEGNVRLWDLADPYHVTQIGQPLQVPSQAAKAYVTSIVFSPDGDVLAAAAGNVVQLWNTAKLRRPTTLPHYLTDSTGQAVSLAFSSDGDVLAVGTLLKTTYLWNMTNPSNPVVIGPSLTSPNGPPDMVAFSPGGTALAIANGDGTISLWHLPATRLTGVGDYASDAAFSPDGLILGVSGGGTGGADTLLWDVRDPEHPVPLSRIATGHAGSATSLAFSRDGTLAVGESDGTIGLWDVTRPRHPSVIDPGIARLGGALWSVASSPDGRVLAAAGDVILPPFATRPSVALWDTTNPHHPVGLGEPMPALPGPGQAMYSVAFSSNGRILATAGNNSNTRVALWAMSSVMTPRQLGRPLVQPADANSVVTFSPDGRILAVGSSTGSIRLWNITDPSHPVSFGGPLTTQGDEVLSVAFSSDSRTLAAGESGGTVGLWNVTNPANPTVEGSPLTVQASEFALSVAFSPDRDFLAASSANGVTLLWDRNVNDAIKRICESTAGAMSQSLWNTYVRPLPYSPPCGT